MLVLKLIFEWLWQVRPLTDKCEECGTWKSLTVSLLQTGKTAVDLQSAVPLLLQGHLSRFHAKCFRTKLSQQEARASAMTYKLHQAEEAIASARIAERKLQDERQLP